VEEFSSSRENRSFRFGYSLLDDVSVGFANGSSVERLPVSMIGAWGKCRFHGLTPRKGYRYFGSARVARQIKCRDGMFFSIEVMKVATECGDVPCILAKK
jgi:hypothetical protein